MSQDITAGQPIRVTQGVPDMEVVVADDVTIVHEGVEYKGGDTVTLPGPMAEGFVIDGAAHLAP